MVVVIVVIVIVLSKEHKSRLNVGHMDLLSPGSHSLLLLYNSLLPTDQRLYGVIYNINVG